MRSREKCGSIESLAEPMHITEPILICNNNHSGKALVEATSAYGPINRVESKEIGYLGTVAAKQYNR